MKKSLYFTIISLILCIAISSCTKDKTHSNTLTIGIMPDVDSIPFIIAEKNGYYQEENVNIKIEYFKSAKDRDSALQSGSLDGVITDMLAVIFANEGGIRLIVPAKSDGDIKLVASKKSGITTIKDVKGKKVGLSTNTIMEYTVDKILELEGIRPEEISKIAIPQIPTRLEMLNGGKIDAAILPDPLSLLATKDGAYELCSIEKLKEDISIGVVAFTEKVLTEKTEQTKALFRAYNKAVDYLHKEPIGNYIDFIIKTQGFPENIKDAMKLPKYTKAELPSEKNFYSAVKWLKGKNLIKNDYDYASIVNNNYLR